MRLKEGLAILLLAAFPLRAEEAFSVIRVARGADAVTFEALPSGEVRSRQADLARYAREAHERWEAAREAFSKRKENLGKEFLDLEPEPVKVSTAREGFAGLEQAQAWADEATQKVRLWALVRIIGWDGKRTLEVLERSGIRARREALLKEYRERLQAWEEDPAAHPPAGSPMGLGSFRDPAGAPLSLPPRPRLPALVRIRVDFPTREAAEKELESLK